MLKGPEAKKAYLNSVTCSLLLFLSRILSQIILIHFTLLSFFIERLLKSTAKYVGERKHVILYTRISLLL